MTFIPNKELQGINSDQYEAPSENCSCSAATIAVAIDRATGAQLVTGADSFTVGQYDKIELTYVAAGNGTGEIETATYTLNGTTVATLTFAYNANDKLESVTQS